MQLISMGRIEDSVNTVGSALTCHTRCRPMVLFSLQCHLLLRAPCTRLLRMVKCLLEHFMYEGLQEHVKKLAGKCSESKSPLVLIKH